MTMLGEVWCSPTSPSMVMATYSRAILQKLWLDTSNGTVYVIYPEHWPTPDTDRFRSW